MSDASFEVLKRTIEAMKNDAYRHDLRIELQTVYYEEERRREGVEANEYLEAHGFSARQIQALRERFRNS